VLSLTLGQQRHELGEQVMYDLPAPIVVAGWRRLGYEPLVAVVVDSEEVLQSAQWRENPPQVIAMLRRMEVETVEIAAIPPLSVGSTAQVVRLALFACESLWDAELVITSDADSLPVDAAYFGRRDPTKRVTVYHADILGYVEFAICYVSASSATWREFLNLPTAVSAVPDAFAAVHTGGSVWGTDQIVLTRRLQAWSGYEQSGEGETQLIELPEQRPFRLDRSCCSTQEEWDATYASWKSGQLPGLDFHLFRLGPGSYDKQWRWTKDVLGDLFPRTVVAELDAFYKTALATP
jgi:hypothetical protein